MFAKDNIAIQIRALIPAIAVCVACLLFFKIPQHQELEQLSAAAQQQRVLIEKLAHQVNAHQESSRDHSGAGNATGSLSAMHSTSGAVSQASNEQTFVQAFARVLSVFQSHGVHCTAAKPEPPGQGIEIADFVTHKVSLTGNFSDVLAAMEVIQANHPQALASELTMSRTDPAQPCQWEIAFRFKDRIQ